VTRCRVHGGPGAQVWVWTPEPVAAACPCADAERFVVVHEWASGEWLAVADVVVARQTTRARAEEVVAAFAWLPGRPLVYVPCVAGGVIAGRCGRLVAVPPGMCAVCVHPWFTGLGKT
jgi:hypothetical protein